MRLIAFVGKDAIQTGRIEGDEGLGARKQVENLPGLPADDFFGHVVQQEPAGFLECSWEISEAVAARDRLQRQAGGDRPTASRSMQVSGHPIRAVEVCARQ